MDNDFLNTHLNALLNECLQDSCKRSSFDKIEININIDKKRMEIKDIMVSKFCNGENRGVRNQTFQTETPSLEYLQYTVDDVSQQNGNVHGECCLCLHDFNNTDCKKRTLISCGHSFCETCLHNLLHDHTSCPLCKKEIMHKKYNLNM